jgi:hypothetical protein
MTNGPAGWLTVGFTSRLSSLCGLLRVGRQGNSQVDSMRPIANLRRRPSDCSAFYHSGSISGGNVREHSRLELSRPGRSSQSRSSRRPGYRTWACGVVAALVRWRRLRPRMPAVSPAALLRRLIQQTACPLSAPSEAGPVRRRGHRGVVHRTPLVKLCEPGLRSGMDRARDAAISYNTCLWENSNE